MRVQLITLRFSPTLGAFDDRPLSSFIRDKEILSVREHHFTVHEIPHIAMLLTYEPGQSISPQPPKPKKNGKPTRLREDPSSDLSPSDRTLFESFREWRNETAREEGVPPYVILTNRQIVAIVKERPDSNTALGQIEGFGPAKVKRYASSILGLVPSEAPPAPIALNPSAGEKP